MNAEKMLADMGYRARAEMASRDAVPEEEIPNLMNDEDPRVRMFLALNSSTPIRVLNKMGKDINPIIRAAVAANVRTESKTLAGLAKDDNFKVLYWVARHLSTPRETLEMLSRNEKEFIRVQVATNPETPESALERLSGDANSSVRERIDKLREFRALWRSEFRRQYNELREHDIEEQWPSISIAWGDIVIDDPWEILRKVVQIEEVAIKILWKEGGLGPDREFMRQSDQAGINSKYIEKTWVAPIGQEFPKFLDIINRPAIMAAMGISEPFVFYSTLSSKTRRDFARIMGTLCRCPNLFDMESGTIKRKLLKKSHKVDGIFRAEFEKYGVLSPGSKAVDIEALERMIYDRLWK